MVESIHDTTWAITTAARLAREGERERIVALLEETKLSFAGRARQYVGPGFDLAISLIKEENNGS